MSNFYKLKEFIIKKMRMSHIYQPLMLIELIKGNGKATSKKIAKSFLDYDVTQIQYYEQIIRNMPYKILSRHINELKSNKDKYFLDNFDLTDDEKKELIKLCEDKLNNYISKRGIKNILGHRTKSPRYISGSTKYKVLKRAKGRCELCFTTEKALEVDHIIPRGRGGKDDLSNYQALCYSCNSMKRDTDDTDFRGIPESYKHREKDCIFCNIPKKRIIKENDLVYAIKDNYPVTDNHCLVIPKRHFAEYFDIYQPEINACNQMISGLRSELEKKDKNIKGFNIGINSGIVAGQTVLHTHIHLIPRRNNDVDDPRGGVRGVIKDKQKY